MIFLIAAAVILGLFIILLFMPVEFEFTGNFANKPVVKLRIYYLCRLIVWDVGRRKQRNPLKQRDADKAGAQLISLPLALQLIGVHGLVESAGKLIIKLVRSIKPGRVAADLAFSLGDDYHTAMLMGALLPLQLYSEFPPQYNIRLQPVFEGDLSLEGYIYGSWQMRPAAVTAHCLAFAFSRPAWRAAALILEKKCGKRS